MYEPPSLCNHCTFSVVFLEYSFQNALFRKYCSTKQMTNRIWMNPTHYKIMLVFTKENRRKMYFLNGNKILGTEQTANHKCPSATAWKKIAIITVKGYKVLTFHNSLTAEILIKELIFGLSHLIRCLVTQIRMFQPGKANWKEQRSTNYGWTTYNQ